MFVIKKKIKSLIRPLYKLLSFLLIPFLRFRELDQDFQLLLRQIIGDNTAGNKTQPVCLIFGDTNLALVFRNLAMNVRKKHWSDGFALAAAS